MKKTLLIFILLISVFAGSGISTASAQCAMCTISAEQGTKNGNTQAVGINKGVIYLMIIPYALIAGLGIIWYKKYRKSHSAPTS